jgi:hypothetical protein
MPCFFLSHQTLFLIARMHHLGDTLTSLSLFGLLHEPPKNSHRPWTGMLPSFGGQPLALCPSTGYTKEASSRHNPSSCEHWHPKAWIFGTSLILHLKSRAGLWKHLRNLSLINSDSSLRTPYKPGVPRFGGVFSDFLEGHPIGSVDL